MYSKCNCSRLCKLVADGGRVQVKEERPSDVGRQWTVWPLDNQVGTDDTGKNDAGTLKFMGASMILWKLIVLGLKTKSDCYNGLIGNFQAEFSSICKYIDRKTSIIFIIVFGGNLISLPLHSDIH